jgi:isoleucyl-tRNA synthetase
MQNIVDLGRTARERRGIALKMPLKSLVVIHPDTDYLEDVQSLREYICRELNIHDLITTSNESEYDVQYSATADFPVLGKKLKLDAKKVFAALPKLSNEQVCQMVHDQSITVEGVQVDAKDLVIRRSLKKDKSTTLETNTDGDVLLILDLENSRDLRLEGLSREVIRQVQRLRKRLRKKMSLVLPDDMQIEYEVLTDPENIELEEAFVTHASSMSTVLRAPVQKKAVGNENEIILEEFQEVQGATFLLRFCSL